VSARAGLKGMTRLKVAQNLQALRHLFQSMLKLTPSLMVELR
jgi:hypothetical protein